MARWTGPTPLDMGGLRAMLTGEPLDEWTRVELEWRRLDALGAALGSRMDGEFLLDASREEQRTGYVVPGVDSLAAHLVGPPPHGWLVATPRARTATLRPRVLHRSHEKLLKPGPTRLRVSGPHLETLDTTIDVAPGEYVRWSPRVATSPTSSTEGLRLRPHASTGLLQSSRRWRTAAGGWRAPRVSLRGVADAPSGARAVRLAVHCLAPITHRPTV